MTNNDLLTKLYEIAAITKYTKYPNCEENGLFGQKFKLSDDLTLYTKLSFNPGGSGWEDPGETFGIEIEIMKCGKSVARIHTYRFGKFHELEYICYSKEATFA